MVGEENNSFNWAIVVKVHAAQRQGKGHKWKEWDAEVTHWGYRKQIRWSAQQYSTCK